MLKSPDISAETLPINRIVEDANVSKTDKQIAIDAKVVAIDDSSTGEVRGK
ncbi:hypothetical protein KP79_PYT23040 [Mizuhopecten yessoensis]|uniref:Uncharacterized protein n=1 Tax=Mizuhopecten yessoensis TaxID=6573 RepID=A0A210PH64_MIZYE|nr:hypothetical protein KP79_PYT23040 [Mizuhopecten yessoensis]